VHLEVESTVLPSKGMPDTINTIEAALAFLALACDSACPQPAAALKHRRPLELTMRHHGHITFYPMYPRRIAHFHSQTIQALAQGPIENALGVLLPFAAVDL
jgi:hypothetical protein